MRTLITTEEETIINLAERLKYAKGKSEFQRIQCILLRLTLQAQAKDIAQVLGWTPGTVRVMHHQYAKLGDAFFAVSMRGGRRRQNMTLEEEAAFLSPFLEKFRAGGNLVVADIKRACEEHLGHVVAESTVYRMLARHGWKKNTLRPNYAQVETCAAS